MTPYGKNALTWYTSMYHMTGLKQTCGFKTWQKRDSWVSRSNGKSSTSAKLKKQQTYRKYFFTQQQYSNVFLLEGAEHEGLFKKGVRNGCPLRSCVRSVTHELCHLNLIPKLSTVDMIAWSQISPVLSNSAG